MNSATLDARPKAKRTPILARKWIQRFREDRDANIVFDGFQSQTAPLDNAGLERDSPLSPGLFAFVNFNLVDQSADFRGGTSAYIEDDFRWRVGRTRKPRKMTSRSLKRGPGVQALDSQPKRLSSYT